MLTGKDLGVIVDDARARVVYLSAPYAALLPAIADGAPELEVAVVDGETPGGGVRAHRLGDVAADRTESAAARTLEDSPAFWLYTSGTTGTPKGAMHRHVDLRATAETYAANVLHTGPDDRFFSVAKLFFAYGLGNSLTFPFAVGATSILWPERPTPPGVAEICAAAPAHPLLRRPGLLRRPARRRPPPRHARLGAGRRLRRASRCRPTCTAASRRGSACRCSTASAPPRSSTSSAPTRSAPSAPAPAARPSRVTSSSCSTTTASRSPRPTPPAHLYVKGESLATGYWCRTATSRQVFAGEWMRTGDIYTRSADGYYTCLGRSNDMIKPGGIWVSPAEVEAVLIEHADVLEAAVVGARNEDGLEESVAFVVARSGAVIDAAAIDAHCRERMAAFKRPRRVLVIDALPKTATGKVQRYALRERLSAAN